MKARPGGRNAQVRAAIFDAVSALLVERAPTAIGVPDIAARAGVAATSIYRRWPEVSDLLLEVAVERLRQDWPMPDTGSLAGDLAAWARRIAVSFGSPEGAAFFRVLVATAPA